MKQLLNKLVNCLDNLPARLSRVVCKSMNATFDREIVFKCRGVSRTMSNVSEGAFQENSEPCSTVDYFRKSSVLDVSQSSQYASEKGPRVT